jgi:hypothetical protein
MISLAIYISTVFIGGLVWAVRLEGRVNTQETLTKSKHEDLKELITTRFDSADKRMERIERSMNGRLFKE